MKSSNDNAASRRPKLRNYELEVHRELEKTLFDADELQRKIFRNDFEKYFAARMDIEKYCAIVEDYTKRKMEKHRNKDGGFDSFDHSEPDFEFEMPMEEMAGELSAINPQDSDLYQTSFSWCTALMRWLELQYENPEKQNKDAYRALNNCLLVSAKIAFAGFMPDDDFESSFDPLDSEVSRDGVQLAKTFLDRTLESLNKLLTNPLFDKDHLTKFILVGCKLREQIVSILSTDLK